MTREYVDKRNGGYYVAGTRVPLESIVYAFRVGESPEMIRRNFSTLSLEQVYGAVTNQAAIDDYLMASEKEWDALASEHPLPDALRAKLDRARQDLLVKRS